MRRVFLVCAMMIMCIAAGCGRQATTDKDLAYVDAREAVEIAAGRKGVLGLKDERGVFVDPRTVRAYREGHIPGAISMPLQDVADRHEELNQYTSIIVYGDGYGDGKAIGMSKRLLELGHKDVRTLEGGLDAWRDAGLDIETDE